MIERLCVIGVGLIGGSLARALKKAGACKEIIGAGRSEAHLQKARELGVIDRFSTDPAEAVQGADMVVVAVPLGAMESVFRSIAPVLPEHAVLTDVGSAKAAVIAAAAAVWGEAPAFLVPGHPIAGTEQSGVEASFDSLFDGRRVILTPAANAAAEAIARVRAMWETTGARVSEMAVEHHDQVLAATSHLPHMLAFALVDTLASMSDKQEIFEYAAGGFRDFTRIASSDPAMWRDICLANREAVLAVMEQFTRDLGELTEALQHNDGEAMLKVFHCAKQARDRFNGVHADEQTMSSE